MIFTFLIQLTLVFSYPKELDINIPKMRRSVIYKSESWVTLMLVTIFESVIIITIFESVIIIPEYPSITWCHQYRFS